MPVIFVTPGPSAEVFSRRWCEAVMLAGPRFFGPGDPSTTNDHRDLRPDFFKIGGALGELSICDAQFLVAMYCLFTNDDTAEALVWGMVDYGYVNLVTLRGMTYALDERRMGLISELMSSYVGW